MAARDIIQAAAGAAGATEANYIEDVFSTYLYAGTGASQTINNGIDLATKGGMVWIKDRTFNNPNTLTDTSRGTTRQLLSHDPGGQQTVSDLITSFGSTGFTLGVDVSVGYVNYNANKYASWTFRRQPKFFDIVTYTGTGSAITIAHNLGATPGMIIVKRTDANGNWQVYHNGLTSAANSIQLNSSAAQASATTVWNSTAPTSSVFSVGTDATVNASGGTYVAYLFAASNSGGFGPAGADSVVACGSYTGNGTTSGPTVTLGWEPQFVLVKMASSTGNWDIFDNMRGILTGSADPCCFANSSAAESTTSGDLIDLTATGFQIKGTNAQVNTNTGTYIYLAIRRGPMKTPTDATKVFSPLDRTATGAQSAITGFGFSPDLIIPANRNTSPSPSTIDKLRGRSKLLNMQTTGQETTSLSTRDIVSFDQNGFTLGLADYLDVNSTSPFVRNSIFWNFARAPGFFDVVCYTGTGSATTVAHNLGVAPELMIVKSRSAASATGWLVYSTITGNGSKLYLNLTNASTTDSTAWNSTTPTNTVFSIGTNADCNTSAATYVAYLFATCTGVSKVFSYTGNGSSQTINCGFAAGARFVLIKRTDSTGDWYVWDTARGIVSANDPHLSLNTTAAEVTTDDTIDPDSSGFIVNQVAATNVNVSSATYIGLAIA